MTKPQNTKLKLLAHLDMRHSASRDAAAGILRFIAISQRWEVQIVGAHPSNGPIENFTTWRPDALIIDESFQSLDNAELRALSGKVTVFVNATPPKRWRRPHAVLSTDDRALAAAAAAHLMGKGLANFGFVGSPGGERWSVTRMRLFRAALKEAGFSLDVFPDMPAITWKEHEKALSKWLSSLPKPCGVWTAFDHRAKHVIDACHLAGINVPDQIQVLGTDNESYICEQTRPSLSSVVPDFENGGFAAAEFIDGVLQAPTAAPRRCVQLHFPMKGIVERFSTSDVNGTARHVALAREFIRKNAVGGIGVPQVAASVGISVRLLQRDYRAVTGHTIIEDLQTAKLDHVKRLLRTTATPIDAIGQLCGFRSPAHLKTLFKARFGMTMSTYRESRS